MLQKFEKYLVPLPRMGNIKLPKTITAEVFLVNQNKMTPGLVQRVNVQPENILPSQNKNRIGFHSKGGREFDFNGDWSYICTSSAHNRKVRVYQAEINHMQYTPYVRRGSYVLQMENTGYSRSNGMLWARASNDPWHRFGDKNEIVFANMATAYHYARSLGFEVDVIYSHERYHEQKSYADNFVHLKETMDDIDCMEDISIENLEKKLI